MKVLGRDLKQVTAALFKAEYYRALANTVRYSGSPLSLFSRYVIGTGKYPYAVSLRTPVGSINLKTYSSHDIKTVNEIFFRLDYGDGLGYKNFIDIGSNIGISMAFFLTRSADAKVFGYEPVPNNISRLRDNLAPFANRYTLTEAAVSTKTGPIKFAIEPVGRYSGIGRMDRPGAVEVEVPGVDINDLLEGVLREVPSIDLLKIDTEGAELATLQHIRGDLLPYIGMICAEEWGDSPALPGFRIISSFGQVTFMENEQPRAAA